jgi:hypothetical protein
MELASGPVLIQISEIINTSTGDQSITRHHPHETQHADIPPQKTHHAQTSPHPKQV